MRKLILGLFTLASLYLPFSGPVEAQTAGQASVVGTCGTASYPTGTVRPVTQDTTGTQCASGGGGGGSNAAAGPTGSAVPADGSYNALNVGGTLRGQTGANPSGTVYSGQTDLTSVGGNTALTGSGLTGNGSPRVTDASSSPASSTALAANQVVCNAACELTSFDVGADSTLSGAAWWIMIFNATSAPADGAVTPAKCYPMPSGSTGIAAAFPGPLHLTTGAVIGVSTTGCFSKTASTHAFISGDSR